MVQKCAYELHEVARDIIPFKNSTVAGGEVFQFDYERLLRFLLKTFGLHKLMQQEYVEVCMTMDGAV